MKKIYEACSSCNGQGAILITRNSVTTNKTCKTCKGKGNLGKVLGFVKDPVIQVKRNPEILTT